MEEDIVKSQIVVKRLGKEKFSISTNMPILFNEGSNQTVHIRFPLLGDIEAFCKKTDFIDTVVKETISCFVLASNIHGKGLKTELESLGWTAKEVKSWRMSRNQKHPSRNLFNIETSPQRGAIMHSAELQLQD